LWLKIVSAKLAGEQCTPFALAERNRKGVSRQLYLEEWRVNRFDAQGRTDINMEGLQP